MHRSRHILAATRASVLVVALVTALRAQEPAVGPGGGGGFGRGAGEILSLLNYPAVQDDLNLTADQKTKVNTVRAAIAKRHQALLFRRSNDSSSAIGSGNAEVTDGFGGGRSAPTPATLAAFEATQGYSDSANTYITNKILTRKQVARLWQIDLQRRGVMAILEDDVAMKLNISEDVLALMRSIQDESRQARRETYLNLRQNGPTFQAADGQLDRAAMQAYRDRPEWRAAQVRMQRTTDQMQAQTIAQIGKLLSKNQKAKFKAMRGKDFDLTKLTNNPPPPVSPEAASSTPAKGQPKSTAKE